jgi:hypothetical protein
MGVGQAVAHEPQCCGSFERFLQAPEHPVCPDAQLRQLVFVESQPLAQVVTAGATHEPALQVLCPRAPSAVQLPPPHALVGKTHVPSARLPQVPPQLVPEPVHAAREPWVGPDGTGAQVPSFPARSHARHGAVQAWSQQ